MLSDSLLYFHGCKTDDLWVETDVLKTDDCYLWIETDN